MNGASPIESAYPSDEIPPVVQYPYSTATYGREIPTRAHGRYEAEVGRPWISQEGINWWMSFFSSPSQLWTSVSVTLFDPRTDSWRTGSAIMWRPTFKPESMSSCIFSDFKVRFAGVDFD